MTQIRRVSEITVQDLADYLRISELTDADSKQLETMLNVAINYVSDYTGRSITELDYYQSFVVVVFVLVQDMWDNRSLYVDGKDVSAVVQSILGMHSVNLL